MTAILPLVWLVGVMAAEKSVVVHKIGERGIKAPVLITRIEPGMPDECARSKWQSPIFVFSGVIGQDGRVRRVKTVKAPRSTPPCPQLEESCLSALAKWRYEPATLEGRPVAVEVTITTILHLR